IVDDPFLRQGQREFCSCGGLSYSEPGLSYSEPRLHSPRVSQNPLVRVEPLDRAKHAVTYGKLRLPAETSNFRSIEKNKRIIADPTTITACIVELRRKSHSFGDPAN